MEDPKIVILNENGTPDEKAMKRQELKDKAQKVWGGIKKGASNAWSFFKANKEDILLLTTTGAAAIAGIKKLASHTTAERRDYNRDYVYYDRSYDTHLRLKRPLTNAEQIELMKRRQAGEFSSDILEDMGVLRRW